MHLVFQRRWLGSDRIRRGGFTLVEVLVAVSLLGVFAASALTALTQANNYAALSRLYTGAQMLAQNQIDLIMSKGPFNPQKNQIPAVLTLGTTTETSALNDLTIYSEPGASSPLVIEADERITTITDTNKTLAGRSLNLYTATVIVKFQYRGKDHQVQLNAMRASDVDGG